MAYEERIDFFTDLEDGDEVMEGPGEESDGEGLDEGLETEKAEPGQDDEGIDLEDPEE